jgi:FTR1 family protein
MIPTLVIALREGVEASLIVGIVAAFLVKEGRRDALGWVWAGIGIALALCVGVALLLRAVGQELPQRQQEGLETVVGLIAVAMITYMVVWMRRHARGLRATLEGSAALALAAGTTLALVAMAFLAVLREGFETAVFMLAAFQDTSDPTAAGAGAVIGLVGAIVLGIALYRGGLRINLARFFRATGLVLVLVAAGLFATTIHTAHEAGWVNALQGQALDLSWLVKPGTVSGSLLTGMLGLQPEPTVGEALGYLIYAVPMGLYVVWPDRWRPSRRRLAVAAGALVAVVLIAGCGSGGDPPAGAKRLSVALTDAGCEPAEARVPAGPVTFEVTNEGSAAVTELEVLDGDAILGERENLTDGLSGSFSLTLEQGDYTLYCPNGNETERGTLTVTGSTPAARSSRSRPASGRAASSARDCSAPELGRSGSAAGAALVVGRSRQPAKQLDQRGELVLVEALAEQPLRRGDVAGRALLQLRHPHLGELGVGDPRVLVT